MYGITERSLPVCDTLKITDTLNTQTVVSLK